MNQELHQCVLCCEQSKFIGLTKCNHGPFCMRCVYKMRVISKNNSCPICKDESKQLVITDSFQKFQNIKGEIIADKTYSDVLHYGKQASQAFQKLMEMKCFVRINGKTCKHDKSFTNMAFLKKHLKQEHKRVLCDVCLEKKTCVLQQQILYTQAQLTRHLDRGDIDQSGNIIFMHPYCRFCKRYFFNDEQFRVHIHLEHMICNVCGNQQRYRFYSNYDSLQTHYKITHYICSDANCLAKKFIAFRSAEQLRIHKAEVHKLSGGKKIDGIQLCGFQYEGVRNNQDVVQIKDNEGVDMQQQFLAMKKSKNRALGEVDSQIDATIDLRDFYPSGMQQDEHFQRAFVLKHHKQSQDQTDHSRPQTGVNKSQAANKNNKKKYVQKAQFQKEKPILAKENRHFTVQELSLLKTLFLSKLYYDQFTDKMANIVDKDALKELDIWRGKYHKKQLTVTQFLTNFFGMMKKFSLKSGYQIFPHYIRTVTNDHAKQELDNEYKLFLKKLPSKHQSILSKNATYGQLMMSLQKNIEINIEDRIVSKKLSLKKMPTREKQRLFQIIGVVRRLKTQQMIKMKFASNFGVSIQTCQFIIKQVIMGHLADVQSKLSKIQNQQFLDLYVFVKYAHESIIHSQHIMRSKNKINNNILQDFLYDRPGLEQKFGQKKDQLNTLEQKVEYEKNQQQRNQKKKLKDMENKNKSMGYHSTADFNLNDKGDFPDLMQPQKIKSAQSQATSNAHFRDVIESVKSKPATYQKKINQLFPTLGSVKQQQQSVQQSKQDAPVFAPQKKQKAWWQKINDTKKINFEQETEVVKVRKGGKNKKQKWVSVKGIFN